MGRAKVAGLVIDKKVIGSANVLRKYPTKSCASSISQEGSCAGHFRSISERSR
jgi:hypothetical protein